MRDYCYKVRFKTNDRYVLVWASCEAEAKILAQADQIDKGLRYDDLIDACIESEV